MTTSILPATHAFPGFKVTKTDSATIFHRIPIFAECKRGDFTADARWIQEAVKEAKLGERGGHLPPLHAQHHDPHGDPQVDAKVVSVGVFKVLGAAPLTFKGRRVTAIYADLIVTDAYFADELCRMKFPYRSVEIFDPGGSPKINGLALLDHEAPYLELPMLMAGEIDDQRTGEAAAPSATFQLNYSRNPRSLVLGSARRGKREILLFRFNPDEVDTMDEDDIKPDDELEQNGNAGDGAENFADDKGGDGDDENMEGDEGGGMDVSGVVKAIESGDISVADMDAILAAIQNQKSESDLGEDEEDVAPAPVPGAEIMSANKTTAKMLARSEAKILALEARLNARDAKDTRVGAVKKAMKRLEGVPLGDIEKLENKLLNFHKRAKGDSELFDEFVDTLAKSVRIGDDDDEETRENFKRQPKAPKEALAFHALGDEALEKAIHFARQYDQIGGRMRASRESHIRVNMKRLGYELEEEAAK